MCMVFGRVKIGAMTYITQPSVNAYRPKLECTGASKEGQSSVHAHHTQRCINWRFLVWTSIMQSTAHVNCPLRYIIWCFEARTYIIE